MKHICALLLSLLRELADESAYERYLEGRPPSREEWRKFADQRYRRKYQNAKCC